MDHNRDNELVEKLIRLNRVAKVVKGGRRFSFSALMVVGDGKGKVGFGFGKANDVTEAIRKSVDKAKGSMISVPVYKNTLPHTVNGVFKSAKVLLKPAAPGTGIIAGGAVRSVMEAVGVHDILSKSLGSDNSMNVIKATFEGLQSLLVAREVAGNRGKSIADMWG